MSPSPAPASSPSSPVPPPADVPVPTRVPEVSPARGGGWRRPRAVVALLFAVVSLVLSFLPLVGGVGALGDLLGPGVVPSSQVASAIRDTVATGLVTCSDDLPARVGATTSCSVLDGADTATVRATVTAVDGDDVRYDLETVG